MAQLYEWVIINQFCVDKYFGWIKGISFIGLFSLLLLLFAIQIIIIIIIIIIMVRVEFELGASHLQSRCSTA
jgi:hypothetical protein